MAGCACSFAGAAAPSSNPPQACASTTAVQPGPCAAPSYARACLQGDPALSPLRIERQSRAEHLWQRSVTVTVAAVIASPVSYVDVLFPAFTSSGNACITSVTMLATLGASPQVAIPVNVVGVGGVWDFTDSTAEWTTRVAIPCEAMTLDIISTTGRCPCKVDCEGCLYPEGVGGKFLVRYRFDALTLAVADSLVFRATGEHTAGPPCCTMPVYLAEEAARTSNLSTFATTSGAGIIQAAG